MNVFEKYADRVKKMNGSDDDRMAEHFIRHFAIESTKLLMDAESMTMFREMPAQEKVNIFVQGVMLTLAGVVEPLVNKNKYDDVTKFTIEYLKMNVDIGITNAHILDEAMKEHARG